MGSRVPATHAAAVVARSLFLRILVDWIVCIQPTTEKQAFEG
jgi:hypothetical protein